MKSRLRKKKILRIGTIITPRGLRLLTRKNRLADCAEVRVDHLLRAGLSVKQIAPALARRQLPVLLTCRVMKEGGVYRWKKGERAAVALLLLAQTEAIDLEIDELPEMQLVLKTARRLKKKIVLSAHSVKKAAATAQLRRWIKKFQSQRAFFFKIAGRINRPRDLEALAGFL